MLDSLKDLYISYPFMPVADAPDWYAHIKDIRCVIVLSATDFISQYKNGNRLRAWLKKKDNSLTIKAECYGITKTLTLTIYDWTSGAPGTMSYMLVDDGFKAADVAEGEYELQPDTLVFMQEAPKVFKKTGTSWDLLPKLIVKHGYNISVSTTPNGFMFFGAAGVGEGTITAASSELPASQQGYGARSLNGFTGDVWLDGSFPVVVDMNSNLELTVGEAE